MILLTASRMPDGLSKSILADTVSLLFPHPDNKDYIENIRERKNDRTACESLFALALLYEQLLSLPCRIDPSALIFDRSELGKPYFKDSRVKFNISHSKGYIAVASSIDEEVGVDVEASELPYDRAIKMAERYFSIYEIKEVKNHPESFARIWSRKEAKAKFFGDSLTNLLEKEKNIDENPALREIRLHRFSYGEIPVTLCTKIGDQALQRDADSFSLLGIGFGSCFLEPYQSRCCLHK